MKTGIVLLLIIITISCSRARQNETWTNIDEGLVFLEFQSPQYPENDNAKITIIKIDPKVYAFRLLCAGEMNHSNLPVSDWCKKYNLIGAINAGMFKTDYKTNVGYMKNFDYINNEKINSKYFSVAAFNPGSSEKPPFKIYDIDKINMNSIINNYNSVIQNLRLIKHPGQNRWSRQNKKWSEAALGQDVDGHVLFIFSRIPHSMHDLNKILLNLPINLVNAQHLEGGPEASLFFSHNDVEIKRVGSFESGFTENNNNFIFWTLPNVLGFYRK